MSNIDKQALREAAEKALPAMKRLLMMPNDELFDEALLNVDGDVDAANVFNLLAGPETMLALLDELEALQSFRTAFNEWHDKTEWMQGDKRFDVIKPWGKHRADVLKLYIDHLESKLEAADQRNAELVHNHRVHAARLIDERGQLKQRIAELEARAFNPAILDVIAERQRQKVVEGWTSEHDDQYGKSQLLWASSCYVLNTIQPFNRIPMDWPWAPEWWKPTGPRRDLVKAGALILAEIERIDRAAGIQSIEGEQKNG
ncbi:hypothetical protein AM352_17075 [Citrobacter koseri]|uniref:ead/Ea22-like family protein n=1 Tax=Citrobacter TaxID=544 RepID=UPI000CE66D36|nr:MULTISPECIES: ead/Ea22-like family protein [Citrobacter]AVE59961.1 hypothetical protein AM352_17075 [Citrobacter koseri]MDM3033640.1 ead/Ea22-like family protein [Citrobacter sp. CK186]